MAGAHRGRCAAGDGVGYGTKGRAAVQTLRGNGSGAGGGPDVVMVDTDRDRLDMAVAAGLVAVHGSACRALHSGA